MVGESFSSSMTGINGGKSRRNSLAGSGNSRERPPSLYRRASIATYHDFCKPGKKHESEEKARLPLPKRITKKPLVELNLYEISDTTQRKKVSAVGSKSLPSSEIHITDVSEVTKLRTSTESRGGNKPIVNKLLSTKEKASVVMLKTKPSPNSRSHSFDTSDIINLEVPTDDKISRENKNKTTRKLKSSPKLKSDLSDAGKVMQHNGSLPSRRVQLSSEKVPFPSKANEECFRKQPATCLKPKSQAGKPLPAVPRQNGSSDMKTGKTSARKNRNLKVVLPQKNRNRVGNAKTEQLVDEHVGSDRDILEEKTLYVIKLETQNVVLESDKNENCAAQDESEFTVTEANHDLRREVEGDTDDKEAGEGKVVLRQQDVVEKQDGKGLFNSIIEETANKLAETRKSKVKALVGAFETLISLQDTKASSNTVSE